MDSTSTILRQLEETYGADLTLVQGDVGQLERSVGTILKSLGVGLLQRLVNQGDKGYQGARLACPCGGVLRFMGYRSRAVHTLVGGITVPRAYYHCSACQRSRVPYDQSSGLGGEQLRRGLAKACSLLAVDDSFAEVSKKIDGLFGEQVSDTTVERLVHHVGSVWDQQQEHDLERFRTERALPLSSESPERLYVGVDGTTVHEADGWHEVKTGGLYWQDKHLCSHKHYVGRFCPSEEFGWHMWLAACRCGLRETREVVYLGDGAAWVRSEHDRHFQRAVFIVDWYHAREHVWACGKALFGTATALVNSWVQERLSLLWEGRTRPLLKDLQKQARRHRGAKRKALKDLHRYLSDHEDQMQYDEFRARGYDIGSGAVEGACKHVVGKRLKQSGMIWSREGSSATLALRLCWLNGQGESFWEQKPLAA